MTKSQVATNLSPKTIQAKPAVVDTPSVLSSRLYALTSRAVIRADAMGLLHAPTAAPERQSALGRFTLLDVLNTARSAGIARALSAPSDPSDGTRWEGLAIDLLEALEESPLPHTEWSGLERVLGADLLAVLVGISPSSLRRYAADARPTPDDVAARLHHVALIVGDLSGSYNDIGVRRWFTRPRSQLDGRAPAALLEGVWDPWSDGPTQVRELAAALLGAPAT